MNTRDLIKHYQALGYEVAEKTLERIVLAKTIKGVVVEQVLHRDGTKLTRSRR